MRGREESDDSAERFSRADWWGVEAGFQPQDDVRVLLDPAGHPFCLYTNA